MTSRTPDGAKLAGVDYEAAGRAMEDIVAVCVGSKVLAGPARYVYAKLKHLPRVRNLASKLFAIWQRARSSMKR